ncbi:MAG: hypothetical protein M1830_001796 [Pleopsidium flavum]|nr:MAG: hypothetical protein M1830_001796 [Pleopsidium flavum]
METLRREKLVKPKQEAAAAEALRKRVEASYTAKTQIEDYEAFKQKFAPVSDGYTDLIEALSGSQDEHPQLKICWLCGIKDMREEFGRYSHLYRHIVRLRKERGKTDESGGKGPPRMSTLWRQRVRHYYLTSPIREQAVLAAMSIHATHSVNTLRRQQRLRPLRIPVKLVENGRACNNEAFEIIAGVIKRDALEADWANQELNRILNPIIDSLKGFQGFLVQLSSLRDFWSKEYPSFSGVAADPVRFGSWQLSYQLERDQTQMMRCFRELEEAVSKRVEKQKQLTKQAQERSAVLLSKYDPSVSDSQSHHKSTTLNLRSTAKLDQASFVGSDSIKQRTSSTKGKDLTPHSANAALPTSDQAQSLVLFRIPEDVKRHTTLVSSSPAPVYWQYTLYRGPDGENVIVHYCKSRETSERIAKLFLSKSVVGFDIEWKPQASAAEGTKKNVSLIQLASAERIALFHIARYGKYETVDDLVAPTLKKIMESPEITKVGVAVKADCTRLRKFMGIDSRGLLELSHLYKLVKFSSGDVKKINKSLVALAQQVEEHLQLPMWKGEVRSSDWSEELNFQQIQYAASDSYAGLQLYNTMEAKRKAIKPMPPCPAHAELNLPIRLANGQTVATYNEPEEMEDESLQSESVSDNDQLPDIEQMAREFLNIAIEDVPPDKVTANSKIKSSPKLKSEKSPEIAAAEVWVADWRSKLPETYKPRATPAYLRAYAVWHEQELGVQETAGLLRDPPLQVTTVSNYILEAIRMEKLPYDLSRLKDVLEHLPESISKSRYQALKRQVE